MKTFIKCLTGFICLLTIDGLGQTTNSAHPNVIVWGDNSYGQTNVPVDLTNAVSIAVGFNFCVALRDDGTVLAWGDDHLGQCDLPANLNNIVAIGAGQGFGMALRGDGEVSVWGNPLETNIISYAFGQGSSNITSIAAGYLDAVLTTSGSVIDSWTAQPPQDLTNAVSIATGGYTVMALRSNGRISIWGDNAYYQNSFGIGATSILLQAVTNWSAVAAGDEHCLALQQNGIVSAWGANSSGQATVPTGLSNVVAIAASFACSYALQANGNIVSWGAVTNPPNMPVAQAIAAGWYNGAAVINPAQAVSPPTIFSEPLSQTIGLGSTPKLWVGAIGYGQLNYQWYFNGTNAIPGATNRFLYISNIGVQQTGQYTVVVSNTAGSISSQPAFINALPTLTINLVPAISVNGGIGLSYEIQYINAIGSPNDVWTALSTVVLTNNPQFYFDASAIGQPQRFYRVTSVNQ